MLSPFRWDHQFNAFIVYSPVLYNDSPLDVKESSLYTICTSTRGQLFKVDMVPTALNAKNQLFYNGTNNKDSSKFKKVHFHPSVILFIDKRTITANNPSNNDLLTEVMQSVAKGDMLSIPVPLISHAEQPSKPLNQLLDSFFHHKEHFYPFPEQGKPRGSFPLFRLQLIHERIPPPQLLVHLLVVSYRRCFCKKPRSPIARSRCDPTTFLTMRSPIFISSSTCSIAALFSRLPFIPT